MNTYGESAPSRNATARYRRYDYNSTSTDQRSEFQAANFARHGGRPKINGDGGGPVGEGALTCMKLYLTRPMLSFSAMAKYCSVVWCPKYEA